MILNVLCGGGSANPVVQQFTNPGWPHFDGRKLGQYKKSIQQYHQYCQKQVK